MIEFDDMIVDIVSNEKLQHIVTELFVRGKKLNIYFVLITQSYLTVPRNIRLNSEFYTLSYYEYSKQMRASKHCK